jgi:hypothetical protein
LEVAGTSVGSWVALRQAAGQASQTLEKEKEHLDCVDAFVVRRSGIIVARSLNYGL